MRKLSSIILVLVIAFMPISTSLASPAPLASQGKAVFVPDDVQAEVISSNIFFRIETGYTSVNTSTVLKNPDSEEAMWLRLGIPVHMNDVSKVKDLSISSDGKAIKAIQRTSLKKPPTDKKVNVKSWYTFDLTLEPGESKVVNCSFVYDNVIESDGSETLSYPLWMIKDWGGDAKNIQIIADADIYPAYAFEPMPSLIPENYYEVGRLTFDLDSTEEVPDNFELTIRPMDTVLTKYMDDHEDAGDEIKSITSSFRNGSYYNTLVAIEELLDESQDIPLLHEVKYLEALCYQNLFELDKALALLDQLEPDPGFGEPLSKTVKNKIVYDKFNIYKIRSGDDKAFEYLNSVKDSVPKDSVFSMWVQDNLTLLAPPPAVEEPLENKEEPVKKDAKPSESQEEPKVIEKITIGEYDFYIEDILIAGVGLLLIIFIITRIIKRRKRRRSSIFRY